MKYGFSLWKSINWKLFCETFWIMPYNKFFKVLKKGAGTKDFEIPRHTLNVALLKCDKLVCLNFSFAVTDALSNPTGLMKSERWFEDNTSSVGVTIFSDWTA